MIVIVKTCTVEIYQSQQGKKPFVEWIESLDESVRYRIKTRLDRVALGNFGDYRSLGQKLFELRFTFGAGYRLYYGEEHAHTIILLYGGDKSSQKKDIRIAKNYWYDYLLR